MRLLNFTKMEGAGNDFMVVNGLDQPLSLLPPQIKRLSHRLKGVGFDQLLLIERPRSPGVDFHYRIFNSDGTEVSQCGNGVRCLFLFAKIKGLSQKKSIVVETDKSLMEIYEDRQGKITANMGSPKFSPREIPFDNDSLQNKYKISLQDGIIETGVVSMGNPHVVQLTTNIDLAPVRTQGPKLENHTLFPNGANVGYMQVKSRDSVSLRVWERGAGETMSCGSGACAAAAIGIRWGDLDSPVTVSMPGGTLQVTWGGVGTDLLLTGPASITFEGSVIL